MKNCCIWKVATQSRFYPISDMLVMVAILVKPVFAEMSLFILCFWPHSMLLDAETISAYVGYLV